MRAAEAEKIDLEYKLPWRVIVRNVNGAVLADTFAYLDQIPIGLQEEGEPASIQDIETGEEVGTVMITINQDYLNAEARRYLAIILVPRLFQGLITAVIAMVLGVWLSRRITSPVINLTEATQAIVQSGETQLLPVISSDELGQMSASFNKMMTSLKTQRELRKRLIDDVAHELNTPLSVIRLEAKGMLDGIKPPEEAADQIMGEVDLLSNLVYDLNWLAETDSGFLRLEMDSYNLSQFLTTEIERWQIVAQASEIDLELQSIPSEIPLIQMDKTRISQALGNLIENALRHTPARGKVAIHCNYDQENVIVSVCDTGVGIESEDLSFVFERFYRTDLSRQRISGGRGLGLSIVKQIAEAHQGRVWVESEPGKGSCFSFSLPIS